MQESLNQAGFLETIKNRGFLNLWVNQILVQLSYNALNFALIIWVFHLTDSNIAVSALLFAVYLPGIIFGLFAGLLTDLTDRKKMITWINLLLAISFFSLIFFKEYYSAILIITFVINSLAMFYVPAESSAIPIIVPKRQLLIANSLFSTTLFASFLIGFGLAGPLISLFDIDFVFGLGGLVLTAAFLLSLAFPSIKNKEDEEGRRLAGAIRHRDLKQIIQFSKNEINSTLKIIRGKLTVVASMFLLAGIQMVIGVLGVILPAFTERELHIKAPDISFIFILPLGVGMVLGGLLIGKYGTKFPKRIIVSRAIIIAGSLLGVVGIVPLIAPIMSHFPHRIPKPFFYQPPISAIMSIGSFVVGLAMVSIVIPSHTVLQENTPEEDRGKVYAVLGVLMSIFTAIPAVLAGALADFVGTRPIFLLMGGTIALIGLLALRPQFFFEKNHLPRRVREFLGVGHWKKKS